MSNKKRLSQITEEEYAVYLKSVQELETLIIAAQKSCEQIERMKKQTINNIYAKRKTPWSKAKRLIKISREF